MGIDVIAWTGCDVQAKLGPDGFFPVLLKSKALAAAGSSAPQHLDSLIIRLPESDDAIPYRDLKDQVAIAAGDSDQCQRCLLTPGARSCFRFIGYPIDRVAERFVLQHFVRQLDIPKSPADQIYHDVVTAKGDDDGSLVFEGDSPLEEASNRLGVRLDSRRLIEALTRNLFTIEEISAFGAFWSRFEKDVQSSGPSFSASLREFCELSSLFRYVFLHAATSNGECGVIFLR